MTPRALDIALRRGAVLVLGYAQYPGAMSAALLRERSLFGWREPSDFDRDMAYLEQKGMVSCERSAELRAWTITPRGIDVILGHISEPGIADPAGSAGPRE